MKKFDVVGVIGERSNGPRASSIVRSTRGLSVNGEPLKMPNDLNVEH